MDRCTACVDNPANARRHTKRVGPTLRRARPLRVLCSLAFVGCLLAACGSSSSASASQTVCNDRAQLNKAVSTFVDDLRAGNFSKAKDDVPAVRDALNSLSQSARELTSQESQALSRQIDDLKKTATSLADSTSLSDLLSGLSSIESQFQSVGSQIRQTLKCS